MEALNTFSKVTRGFSQTKQDQRWFFHSLIDQKRDISSNLIARCSGYKAIPELRHHLTEKVIILPVKYLRNRLRLYLGNHLHLYWFIGFISAGCFNKKISIS